MQPMPLDKLYYWVCMWCSAPLFWQSIAPKGGVCELCGPNVCLCLTCGAMCDDCGTVVSCLFLTTMTNDDDFANKEEEEEEEERDVNNPHQSLFQHCGIPNNLSMPNKDDWCGCPCKCCHKCTLQGFVPCTVCKTQICHDNRSCQGQFIGRYTHELKSQPSTMC